MRLEKALCIVPVPGVSSEFIPPGRSRCSGLNYFELLFGVNVCNQATGMIPFQLVGECLREYVSTHAISGLIDDSELFALKLLMQPGNTDIVCALEVPHGLAFSRPADSRTSLIVFMDFEL